jgi:hypothetical protein
MIIQDAAQANIFLSLKKKAQANVCAMSAIRITVDFVTVIRIKVVW